MSTPCLLTSADTDENQAYALWRQASDDKESRDRLNVLVPLLQKHASSVVWLTLHEQNPELVAEAVQRAILKSATFRGEAKFSTWFQRIVLTLCAMTLRQRKQRNEVPLDNVPEVGSTQDVDTNIELDDAAKRLTDNHLALFNLKRQGLSDSEISRVMGISKSAVKMMWTRVKDKLESYGGKID